MTSVLHGGRRRRRGGTALARLLMALAVVAMAVAAYEAISGGGNTPKPARSRPALQQGGVAAPSTGTAAPDPAQAALAGVDAFHMSFHDPPRAGILFDVTTGEVLWRRNPLTVTPIASLTKIMTALLTVESTRPSDEFRIPKDALNYIGSGVGLLPKGRHVTVEAVLHGLLLPSGNDAAIALADHVAGSRKAFVAQ